MGEKQTEANGAAPQRPALENELPPVRRNATSRTPVRPAVASPGSGEMSSLHFGLLALSSAVLLISIVLDVQHGNVTPGAISFPLPGLCAFRRMTGLDCPGCGLTRCFVSLSHGRLAAAWNFNPAGLLLYGVMLFQIPYRIVQLRRIRTGLPEYDLGTMGSAVLATTCVLMIVQWGVRLALGLL